MFGVGDKVWIKTQEVVGRVAYIEDGYIEVELSNGCEMAFDTVIDLEPFIGQIATPKKREQNWSEIMAARYAPSDD